MKTNKLLLAATLLGAFTLAGCPSDPVPATDAGRDTGPTPDTGGADTGAEDAGTDAPVTPDSGPVTLDCAFYCGLVTTNCADEFAQYEDEADCLAFCAVAGWDVGTVDDMTGATLGCHIYHAGVPAAGAPAVHCGHAGPSGAGVCGSVDFRTDTTGYSRVDRMGMPAVSTALVSSGMKNAYNDGNPSAGTGGDQEVVGGLPRWAPEFATSLIGIHNALNDDILALGLHHCGNNPAAGVADVIGCATQTIGTGGPRVLDIVVPDTLRIDTTMPAGFPNGRRLADPVIDLTLAVVMLDLTMNAPNTFVTYDRDGVGGTGCGGADCPVGLNPPLNDVAEGVFLTTFPYLHPAHAP